VLMSFGGVDFSCGPVKAAPKEKRDSPKRPDHGFVIELLEAINQQNGTVMPCEHLLLVKRENG